jgi:Mn-dependent DtxR family transcriptional regulator
MDQVKERQSKRFQFLKLIYDEENKFYSSEAKPHQIPFYYANDIGNKIGLTKLETEQACSFLKEEGLIEIDISERVNLTHAGRKEVEEAITQPENPTDHFPANITQYIITRACCITLDKSATN